MQSPSSAIDVPLESVLCTDELNRRPSRSPDYETENRALVALAQALADSPRTILQILADTILDVFQSDSAGISLVTEDGKRFHWPAIAGVWKPHIGGGTPRDFGPCGDVLDRNIPLMFRHFERRYTYFLPVTPPVEECLLVPFYVGGQAVGTIWAITHDDRRQFDAEDMRQLVSLGRFASSAYQAVESLGALERQSAKLRDSEIRYRRLFESAKDGILILDANTGKIIDANAFMSGLLGLEAHDLLGKELFEIGLFQDIQENKEAFRELQRTGYLRHDHLPMQNQRGETVEVEFVTNVYREDHRLVAQCNVRDIAERSRMEKKIKQQAEALADEARRKDEFLAMLSHELRNPLAPIRSAVHLLKVHERGSENLIQQQAREIIERQVVNLTKLVSDLLEVSRVISGRIRLNLHTIDMNGIVQHAIETAMPLIEQRKHELVVNRCSDSLWINVDATRMEEAFVNLLNNAAKYTNKGGRIEVACEHHQNHALVRVRDNGIGIDEKLLPHVFDLFTQADRSLDRSQGGLGIGLSLVHRIVELHGGTVEAYSPPAGLDVGSEFIVKVPLVQAPGIEAEPSPPHQSHAEEPGSDGLRILLVDDNLDACTILGHTLRQKRYDVQSVHTGPDGLRVAKQWRPDIVLLDIGLPGMDGYEVARRLRAAPDLKGLNMRLIAMTGYARESDIALAREAGFDAHLVKPFDFDELEKLMVAPQK